MRRPVLLLLALALAVPTPALAAETVAPPGNSGVDQYFEVVPDAGGAAAPRRGAGAAHAPLPAKTSAALQAQGPDGAKVAQIVAESGPAPRSSGASRGKGAGTSGGTKPLVTTPGSEVPRLLVGPVATQSGSGGIGLLLPGALLISTLAIALVVLRRRLAGGAGPGDRDA